MIRRFSLRTLAVLLGAAALVSCADTGPQEDNFISKPTAITSTRAFVDLSLGDFHSCGLQADGEVYCWGLNSQGQSGNGVPGETGTTAPTAVIGHYQFASITAGGSHTCGILVDGTPMCWGNNIAGQLGVGSNQDKIEPTAVAGGHVFTQLSASTFAHTCGLEASGDVWCWGLNDNGQLGTGTHTASNAPALVGGNIKFISISSGGAHTCGIAADSSAYCWGMNQQGQIGDGTNDERLIPTKVAAPIKFKQLATGLTHTCGLTVGGDPFCWGDNVAGALGNGSFNSRNTPASVDNSPILESIVAGERHNCGLDASGTVYCWGYNEFGALGDGTTDTKTAPVTLFSSITFKKIAAGAYHTCGIATSNQTYCWGNNYSFQLGVASGTP